MSDTHSAEDAHDEGFDLSEVPMDDSTAAAGAGEGEGQEGEGEQDGADAQARAAARAPLPPEELQRRYDNTRTALAEERRGRRELERRLEALERGEGGGGQRPRQEERQPAEIDPEVDPIGALQQMRSKIAAYEAAAEQESRTAAERVEQNRYFERVEAELRDHEADFRDDHPDYDEAAKHYATARAKELMSFGLPPQKVEPLLREEFAKLTSSAIAARKNPAAVVYEMAKGRGFGQGGGQGGAGERQGGKLAGKLDALERGQKLTSPLGRTGGRPSNGLDAQTVANINIHDPKGAAAFDKAFEAMEREARRAERGR